MQINYPQTILSKSHGFNESEEYLHKLCKKTFLSLWCFPNLFRNQGNESSGGDGKELCDLLVVFENHVIIFSDKKCEFDENAGIKIAWNRWYKSAILAATKQIAGAERWILQHPDRIYIDNACQNKFPFNIPDKQNIIIHRVVVSHGSSKKCKEYYGGSGSFFLNPMISGDEHYKYNEHNFRPFHIGFVNPPNYVHVFDDITLDIIMRTLDTISDFTNYLTKKEELLYEKRLIAAASEEDLLAYYLMNIDDKNQHGFVFDSESKISIMQGIWNEFDKSLPRNLQVRENEISYSWDKLIEKFSNHITTGTSYYMSHPYIKDQEELLRQLSKTNRFERRVISERFHELLWKTPDDVKSSRIVLINNCCYIFLLLPRFDNILEEQYRECRLFLLQDSICCAKLKFSEVNQFVGIATEPETYHNRSEDAIFVDTTDWTEQDLIEARQKHEELVELGFYGESTRFSGTAFEYPFSFTQNNEIKMKGRDRNKLCPCGSGKKYKKCCVTIS